jgi:hypothetical protein
MTDWTPPRSWVTGELVTPAQFNTHVRDNELHLKESVTTLEDASTDASANLPRSHFAGLYMRTHPDNDSAAAKVMLVAADEISMSDGARITSWAGQTADLAASGANGLDTGGEAASTWYSLHAIAKSSDGTKGMLFHKAPTFVKVEQDTHDAAMNLRDSTARTRLGQTFQAAAAGSLGYADLYIGLQAGTVTGNVWIEVYDNSAGVPGTLLATSDKYPASSMISTHRYVRFLFRSPAALAALTTYHLVLQADYSVSGGNHLSWYYQAATNPYASGTVEHYNGVTWTTNASDDFRFRLYVSSGTSTVTMPTGYDQRALVGYAYNDASSNLRGFVQYDRSTRYLGLVNLVTAVAHDSRVFDVLTHCPPVRCGVLTKATALGSADIVISGVPDGFRFPAVHAAVLSANVAGEAASLPAVWTEGQGLYVRGTGATITVDVAGFDLP